MTTPCRVVILAASALLALGGCAGGAGDPADSAAIASWAEPAGIAPELVYVTSADGFELATQSVGVFADDGMSAGYWGEGGTFVLTTWREAPADVVPCAELPDAAGGGAPLRCTAERGEVHVVLEGDVDAATLRAAGEAVRVPSDGELEHLFSDVQVADDVPVERGDLPPVGDGAPMNEPGPGG